MRPVFTQKRGSIINHEFRAFAKDMLLVLGPTPSPPLGGAAYAKNYNAKQNSCLYLSGDLSKEF